MPCQLGRKRPSAACSAGSTSRRSAASEARRSRRRTSGSHHSRSVPPGPQLAADELVSSRSSSREHRLDVAAEALVRLGGRERAAPAREARDEQRASGSVARLEERLGQPARRHGAERVAVAARVLGGDQPLARPRCGRGARAARAAASRRARVVLALAQVAAQAQQVVQLVGVPRRRRAAARSTSSSASGSSRSRSSSWPSSSRSRSRSSDSACARRSAAGVSSSYM